MKIEYTTRMKCKEFHQPEDEDVSGLLANENLNQIHHSKLEMNGI